MSRGRGRWPGVGVIGESNWRSNGRSEVERVAAGWGRKPRPVITQMEILGRARESLRAELAALEARDAADGLPRDVSRDERQRLTEAITAVEHMIFYECGEYR